MKIEFLGASKTVTGSLTLLTTSQHKILIDCGLFQGSEDVEALNFNPFPFNPSDIDFMLLSHAHIDHSGRIPKLVKEGFKGKIFSTKATNDLCELMLVDSARIQESDVEWENRKRQRAGKPPIKPLYEVEDALLSLRHFEPVLYDQKVKINDEVSVRFKDAGHILGSSIIEIWVEEHDDTVKIVFSGDLGMKNKPLIRDPQLVEDADYLILESTYGDRIHENSSSRIEQLTAAINKTVLRGGTVIIPSFAVGRTQELIYELKNYYENAHGVEEFMKIPIYVDSPMAISATQIFKRNSYCFDDEAKEILLSGNNPLDFENLYFVRDHEESARLNTANYPKVIISASGMCTAGRIRHHLKHGLWDPKNSVIFVGYQAEGTLGRILKDGVKNVKILGENIAVLAEIYDIQGFSGHADQTALLDWVRAFKKKPKKIFLIHGEDDSLNSLSTLIEEKLKIPTIIPNIGFSFQIEDEILKAYSGEVLEPIKRKENIRKELQEVYNQFERLSAQTDRFMDDSFLEKEYDDLKNKLLDLQQELLDLSMVLGKKK